MMDVRVIRETDRSKLVESRDGRRAWVREQFVFDLKLMWLGLKQLAEMGLATAQRHPTLNFIKSPDYYQSDVDDADRRLSALDCYCCSVSVYRFIAAARRYEAQQKRREILYPRIENEDESGETLAL